MVEMVDRRSHVNPAAGMPGVDGAAAETAGMEHTKKYHSRDETRMPEGWDKYFTENGKRYYAERASGISSWHAPAGATGGSTGRPHPKPEAGMSFTTNPARK